MGDDVAGSFTATISRCAADKGRCSSASDVCFLNLSALTINDTEISMGERMQVFANGIDRTYSMGENHSKKQAMIRSVCTISYFSIALQYCCCSLDGEMLHDIFEAHSSMLDSTLSPELNL